MTSTSVLSLLGVRPHLGRLFTPEDAKRDELVVIISHDLWVRRYGADPGILDHTIEINRGTPRQVVGVLPPGFDFPHRETQLWWGTGPTAASEGAVQDLWRSGIARLREGVTVDAAEADLQRMVPSLAEAYPDVTAELLEEGQFRATAVSLKETLVADVRPVLLFLVATAAFEFLLVLANVTNLFLVRAERQSKEIAVEQALGASGRHLARRFLAESLMLTTLGAALGLYLAYVAVRAHFGFELGEIPRLHEVRLDRFSLGAVALLAGLSGLLFAGISLARSRRADFTATLKAPVGRATIGREIRRTQRSLGAAQVALALTLLIGSAVMAQSFWKLRQVELGFDPRNVQTFDINLPTASYQYYFQATRFQSELLDRLRAVPGVQVAEATEIAPLAPRRPFDTTPITPAEGPPDARGPPLPVLASMVTPGYFQAMRIPLRRGRGFRPDDLGEAPAVVVSETLGRTLFRGEDPIGRRVRLTERPSYGHYTVVGVVADMPGDDISAGPANTLYFPIVYDPYADPEASSSSLSMPFVPRWLTVVVRTDVAPESFVPAIRRIVRELDPDVPIATVRTMEQAVAASMARTRLTTLLLFTSSATALLLGVIGVYGVISYTVRQRTPEFGVRLAMGATPQSVYGLVVRQGAIVAVIGIGGGLLAALWLTRYLRGLALRGEPDRSDYVRRRSDAGFCHRRPGQLPTRATSRADRPGQNLEGGLTSARWSPNRNRTR